MYRPPPPPPLRERCWFMISTVKAVETKASDTKDDSAFIDVRFHEGSDRCEPLTQTCVCHCHHGHGHMYFLRVCHMIVKSDAGWQLKPDGSSAESGCLCN